MTYCDTQICKLSFKIINSSTILLLSWKRLLLELEMAEKLLPRDVTTRWNSTYNMLDATLKLKPAVKTFTEQAENGVHDYELGKAEWAILEQLQDVLKVSWQSPDIL
jgi:hypothetical protein